MNKIGLSEVAGALILILITVSLITLVWISFKNAASNLSPRIDCSDISFGDALSMDKACYLNDNGEIMVEMKRKFDNFSINALRISFLPSDGDSAEFELENNPFCSDIRLLSSNYSREYEVVKQGETRDYVFNLSGEIKMESVALGAYIGQNSNFCSIEKINIDSSC